MSAANDHRQRCPWCDVNDPMRRYHDQEWGVPCHDDQRQFEHLMLEVMQCGLNWNMILLKRDVFRQCFANFQFDEVANFTEKDVERILQTENMIKSRRKIDSVIQNARAFQEIRAEFGSFSEYLWGFTGNKTYLYQGHQKGRIPAKNGLSTRIAHDLKTRGMKHIGPVTLYSHLQSCGIINDHLETCFRYQELIDSTDAVIKRLGDE